ncbi:MAG: hypothetical protein J6Y60_06500 [Treponema sp.]|nr:hypothetical protein [Treponema sp.]
MSEYEIVDLLFTAIQLFIDIITRLSTQKRKKRKKKNSPPSVQTTLDGLCL